MIKLHFFLYFFFLGGGGDKMWLLECLFVVLYDAKKGEIVLFYWIFGDLNFFEYIKPIFSSFLG